MQVDIVRDVANLVNAQFMASVFSLPIKNEENPKGIYTVQELYTVLAVMFIAIFYDTDIANSFKVRNGARTLAQQLGGLVQLNVEAVGHGLGFFEDLVAKFHEGGRSKLSDYGVHMIERLLKSGQSIKDIVWTNMIPSSAAGCANQAQLFSQCLDYYLGDGSKYLPELNRLAKLNTPEADELILRYFMEGSRMRHTVGLYREAATDAVIQDGDATVNIAKGRKVLLNLHTASLDAKRFPNPTAVDLTRPLDSYIHYGWGPHACLGYEASQLAMMTMLKTVCGLDGLRRAETAWGPSAGELKSVEMGEGYTGYMSADWSAYWPFPTTMKVRWDV